MPRAPTASAALIVALCAKIATRSLALSIASNGTRSACYSTQSCSHFGWTDQTANPADGIAGVCGGNPSCRGPGTQCSAAEYCRDMGARLCTKDELMACETQGRGCSYDFEQVWSSTPCSDFTDGYYTVEMTYGCLTPGPQLSCYSAASTIPVTGRCCADVSPSTPSCDANVCVYPTNSADAIGDPHLQNIRGERFDLMEEGNHVLINIPRGMSAENALLRVMAAARRLGGHCADMYFQQFNITGSWAEAQRVGGYHYSASQGFTTTPQWASFGKVELKVVHGRTDSGILYLNLYAKHLGRAGFDVGGLLGVDDHGDVMTPPAACSKQMSMKMTGKSWQAPRSPSVAMATA